MTFPVPVEAADRVFAIAGMREMRLTLHLDGCLDVSRLRNAVEQMLHAIPLMRCRFVEHWWQPRWEFFETGTVDDYLVIYTGADRLGDDVCPSRQAMQFVLLHETTDTLIIRFDHVLGDFRTLQKLVQILADTYNALERDPGYALAPCPLVERGFRQYVRGLTRMERKQIRNTGFAELKEIQRAGKWRVSPSQATAAAESSAVVKHGLTPVEVEQIEEYSLQHQATIFQTLLAAYFLAATEVLPESDPTLPIAVLVDLRRRFGQGTPFRFGNLVGLETIFVPHSPSNSLDSVLKAVRQHMFEKSNHSLGETLSPLFYECLPMPIRLLVEMVPYALKVRQHRRQSRDSVARRELVQVAATYGGTFSSARTRFGATTICGMEGDFCPVGTSGQWALHAFGLNGHLSLSFGWGSVEVMDAIRNAFLQALTPVFETPLS